jgi:hypothetical protein
MPSVRSILFWAPLASLACSALSPKDGGISVVSYDHQLFFAAVNPSDYPWSSSLYSLAIDHQQNPELLLQGESADPLLIKLSEDRMVFFNRSVNNQNYRMLAKQAGRWQIGEQKALTNMIAGDPHDAHLIDERTLIITNHIAGHVATMDIESGQTQVIEPSFPFEGLNDQAFHPEQILATDDGSRFLISHQGYLVKDGKFQTNHTQAFFELRLQNGAWIYQDENQDNDVLEGISFRGSFPVVSKVGNDRGFLITAICSRFFREQDPGTTYPCQSSVSRFNGQDSSIQELWDLDGEPYYMNGSIVGKDKESFFASIERVSSSVNIASNKAIALFNISDQSVTDTYTYNGASSGFWAFWYVPERDQLIVGDTSDNNTGILTIITSKRDPVVITLPRAPLSGALIYKK